MLRMICNSRTYQLSILTNELNEDDALNYSHAMPRRLPAEVIYDSVHAVTGAVPSIPGVPKGTRAAQLTDSGIRLPDGFLTNLGRPARESACECERSSELQLGPVMALISGPTIGTAIADPKNELEKIVKATPDDDKLAEELFLRALGRFPAASEIGAFRESIEMIKRDHDQLNGDLSAAEDAWKKRRAELEAAREQRLAETVKEIAARTEAIKPEREKLAEERETRIKQAEAKLAKAKEKLPAKIETLAASQQESPEWFPLAATALKATSGAVLAPQPDRSIVASGKKDKGVYELTFRTTLNHITGFRLETLSDEKLPARGPGLPQNGNFVLTEIEVFAAPVADPKQQTPIKIASGVADFLQQGFSANATFDGKTNDQGGWAVAGATGHDHWVTYKLAEPIKHEGETLLTVKLHQFHNAAEHRLGRFRFSATTAEGEIPLSQPETFAAVLTLPEDARKGPATEKLIAYLSVTDADVKQASEAVGVAKRPVPPDTMLVKLEQRKAALSKPTPDDPALVRLREDVKQSSSQLQNIRLTAAEDLTWALINSPAFLFNH